MNINCTFYCKFGSKLNFLRTSIIFTIDNPLQYKQQLLQWSQQYDEITFLDGNDHTEQSSVWDCLLAVDGFTSIKTDYYNAFEDLKVYQQTTKDWLFGYLSYELKNDIEALQSNNFDGLHFPDLYFFQPKKLFLIKGNSVEMHYLYMCDDEMEEDRTAIESQQVITENKADSGLDIQQRIPKGDYINKISGMLERIHIGDIYEANFCMEFYAEDAVIAPLDTFFRLNAISRPPFAAYFKNRQHFLLCASPERYIRKTGTTVVSQPIKGTARRFADAIEDEEAKQQLAADPKERSENIMIVDLVRNDMSKTAKKGSVQVTELCQIYSFLQVHQMISTITSELDDTHTAVDVLRTTFPMGSMTGAPKISAMTIIEELEETKRGLYSGAVGYFTPESDFDFNVVIRSILYNSLDNYVSFSVGSAITSLSAPENEYEECLLKAKAMFEVLR